MEQELLTLPEHHHHTNTSSSSGVRMAPSFRVMFGRSLFCPFLLPIELSVLGCTASDYPLVSSTFCPLCCLSLDVRLLITLWYLPPFAHCVVCPWMYGFWLPFGIFHLLPIVLSVLGCTASDYPLVSSTFCPLCCLSLDVRLLITLWYLQTFAHCVVYPLSYGFWLPFGIFHLLPIVLSVLWFTASDYPLVSSTFCPLCCLSFDLRLLITFWYLPPFAHCVVCPLIYGFWLPFGIFHLLPIVLSVLWFTASDYPLVSSTFCPLCCLSFDLRLLITLWYLPPFAHCVVYPLIYGFWLPFGIFHLLPIVLSILWFTASDYPLVSSTFCPLCCLSFDLRLLITLWYLPPFAHCVVYPLIYGFWLPFGIFHLLPIVLSILWFTASDYPLVSSTFCPLCCLSFDLRLLITLWYLPPFAHCVVYPLIYGFWLPFGIFHLLPIVLSILWFTASDYPLVSSTFCPLCCLSFDLRLLITLWYLPPFAHCVVYPLIYGFWLPFGIFHLLPIVLSILWFTASDYPLVSSTFCPLCCLSFDLRLLITLWYLPPFAHCVVYPLIYGFWLPFGIFHLLPIVLSILWFTASDYPLVSSTFCPLCCLSFDLRLLITFWYLPPFAHCVVYPLIYGFWLPFGISHLLPIVLSILWFTASDYPLVSSTFCSLCCLSFDLRLLITLWYLPPFAHCVVYPLIYGFWLPFGIFHLLPIVLSILWFTASDYPLVSSTFCPLCCLSFDLRLLITLWYLPPFAHCVVYPLIYGFWLPFGIFHLLPIVLSILWFTASDYPLVSSTFCPLCCLSFDLRLLITLWYLPPFAHCVVYPLIYGFWLPFGIFHLLPIVLSILWFTSSDYPLVSSTFCPLCCLSFDLRLLITLWYLPPFAHCVVYPLIYGFWLPFGIFHLLPIVLSILWFTASDYPLVSSTFCPLCCLSFDLRLLITLWYLPPFAHCVVYPLIYGFWLPFGIFHLLPIVLSILWFTASDYPLVSSTFCPLCCLSFDLRLLITLWYLPPFAHCVVYPLIYGFWLPFGIFHLLPIVLSILWFTASDYPLVSSTFCPLCCLSFDLRLLITLWYLPPFAHCVVYPLIYGFWLPFGIFHLLPIVLSILWFTASDYPLVSSTFCPLCCLSFDLRLLITLWYHQPFAHCVVYPLIYGFWLPFGILWPLSCLSLDVRLLITLWYLQTFAHCVVYPLIYGFWLPFVSCGHWVVCPLIYGFWLPFGIFHLLPIVLSILWFTASDYPLVSCGHWVVCPWMYGFWLPFGIFKLLPIVLSILWFTASDYLLVSCGHWVVCAWMYGFWLTLWYLLILPIVFSILWFTASDYLFGIFKLLPIV